MIFGFIECFYDHLSAHSPLIITTHSWLNWVDEDKVGLKEKPEDTRYIEKIISNLGARVSMTRMFGCIHFCHKFPQHATVPLQPILTQRKFLTKNS